MMRHVYDDCMWFKKITIINNAEKDLAFHMHWWNRSIPHIEKSLKKFLKNVKNRHQKKNRGNNTKFKKKMFMQETNKNGI